MGPRFEWDARNPRNKEAKKRQRRLGVSLAFIFCFLVFSLGSKATAKQISEGDSTEAFEMIALRMQSLSASLDEMPHPPMLHQTIELPLADSEEEDGKAGSSDPSAS
jgi:hypothetical protein